MNNLKRIRELSELSGKLSGQIQNLNHHINLLTAGGPEDEEDASYLDQCVKSIMDELTAFYVRRMVSTLPLKVKMD